MPRAAESDGDSAAFLSSSYGLTPDDWQADVLEGWLGRRRDGRWSAATCGLAVPRQNGKNGIVEIRELFGMVGLGEKFLHTAHEVKTARKAFKRIAGFFENTRAYPELAALVSEIRKTNGQEAIVLRNGGSVEFIARSKGSGRGYTVDVLVLDEAQDLTDDELDALLPTISAAPLGNPQVILTGTPPNPEKNQTGEVFTRVRSDGVDKSDPRLCWFDFGVRDGPLPDVDDRDQWERVNPALGYRLDIGEVEREHKLMSPEGFARERLGWWGDPDSATGVAFGVGRWEACATDAKPPTDRISIGVAVSVDQAWASIGAASVDSDERVHVGSLDRRRRIAWLPQALADLQRKHRCAVVIDGRGPAAFMVEEIEAAGVDLTVATTNDYLAACSSLFDLVQDGRARHRPADSELQESVFGAQKRTVLDRWAWGRKQSTSDVSMLEAVTLAAFALGSDYDLTDSVF